MSFLDEYVNVLCRRLSLVKFVSGEASLKVDAIHRICSALAYTDSTNFATVESVAALMRIFINDWDRTVRSCAFRCLRYCLLRGIPSGTLTNLSVDLLCVTRLEACKSSVERAAVLKFMAAWISKTADLNVLSVLLSSLVEMMILTGSSPSPHAAFTHVVAEMITDICRKHPDLGSKHTRYLFDAFSSCPDAFVREKLIALAIMLFRKGFPQKVGEELITPDIFARILRIDAGRALVMKSVDATFFFSEGILSILMDAFSEGVDVNQLILPYKDELVDHFISNKKMPYLELFGSADIAKIAWKYPDWMRERIETSASGSTSRISRSRRTSLSTPAPVINISSGSSTFDQVQTVLESSTRDVLSQLDYLCDMIESVFLQARSVVLLESLICNLSRLMIEHSNIPGDRLSRVAHLHGLGSEVLWLLCLRGNPEETKASLDSGWIASKWATDWQETYMMSLTEFSMECDMGRAKEATHITINEVQYSASLIYGTGNSAQSFSPIAIPYSGVLMDAPVGATAGVFTISFDSDTPLHVDINDPVISRRLETGIRDLFGSRVSDLWLGSTCVTFEVTSDGSYGLLSVRRQVQTSTTLGWESLNPITVLASTHEGCEWMYCHKLDVFQSAMESVKSMDSAIANRAAWTLGSLLITQSDHALGVFGELDLWNYFDSIQAGTVRVHVSVLFTVQRIFQLANRALKGFPSTLFKSAYPAIPAHVHLSEFCDSANIPEAFTEAHAEVVKEIDALASSVHLKQKSAALSAQKQKNGALFLSVPLWVTVMNRMQQGRYPLAARRVVHSLFLHTLCDETSVSVLDRLR
jgi:hypothetical protein